MARPAVTPEAAPGVPDRSTLAAFLAIVVIAGGNAPAIRYVACESCELDPFWGAALRFLAAAALFAVIARAIGAVLPRGRALHGAFLYGVLQFGAGFGLVYWGLVVAHAGLGQVLIASVPLLTFLLALAHRQETFRWAGLVGAALAVGGIAIVFGSGAEAGVPLRSMLAILAGAICWGEALVVVKGFPPVHPAAMNAVAMGIGGVVLLVLAAIFGEEFVLPRDPQTLGAQAYLVFAGSILVFWLFIYVIGRWTASATSYQLVLIPLVTVPVSAWLQDEKISSSFAVGAVLVLIGVYIGALWRRKAAG